MITKAKRRLDCASILVFWMEVAAAELAFEMLAWAWEMANVAVAVFIRQYPNINFKLQGEIVP